MDTPHESHRSEGPPPERGEHEPSRRGRGPAGPGGPGDGRPRRPGRGGRGEWAFNIDRRGRAATTSTERAAIEAWFAGNLSDGWFLGPAEIDVDDYEVLVIGQITPPEVAEEAIRQAAEVARIERFRTDTRERRIVIAREAEERFGRKVSWGATAGATSQLFTTTSVPVMTRLHMRQRRVLDTLVEGGVARSRSEALAWCVELVGRNETEWIARLRGALDDLAAAREGGPTEE
jgi:hypothetical protein